MSITLPKRCLVCGRVMVKQEDGSWKCPYCSTAGQIEQAIEAPAPTA